MSRPLRYLPPDCPLVEVTCRTIHGRMLLRPSRELNQRILGVLARAAQIPIDRWFQASGPRRAA